jgi:hypothetical protein
VSDAAQPSADYLFGSKRSYVTAVLVAGCVNVMGMAMALATPRRGWREGNPRAWESRKAGSGRGVA